MEVLAVMTALLIVLAAASWSSARSYFRKGRLAGMEEATGEIIRGIRSHYEMAGQPPPDPVSKALEAITSFPRGSGCENSIRRYHARLWIFGDAVGTACWRKGFDACKLQMTPATNKVRIDLSPGEIAQLAALGDLGFKRMMPNDRSMEMHRFAGEQQALAGTCALERLEQSIPKQHRLSDHAAARLALIRNWWPPERKRA